MVELQEGMRPFPGFGDRDRVTSTVPKVYIYIYFHHFGLFFNSLTSNAIQRKRVILVSPVLLLYRQVEPHYYRFDPDSLINVICLYH